MKEETCKGMFWKPIGERFEFKDNDRNQYEFVDYWPTNDKNEPVYIVRAWLKKKTHEGEEMTLKLLPAQNIPKDELQAMGILELLPTNLLQGIDSIDIAEKKVQADIASGVTLKASRKKRNLEFSHLPRILLCSKCNKSQHVSPNQLIAKAKVKGITPEEFPKVYVCLECDPTGRGRKASPKWASLPKELHCSEQGCNFVQKQHPSMTEKMAIAKGVSFEEYVGSWKCKSHRVKKEHRLTTIKKARLEQEKKDGVVEKVDSPTKRRGRKASEKYIGMTSELHCSENGCGFCMKQHPSLSIKAALNKGITFQDFIKGWKCKSHRGNK